jgi:hypothetical protein
METAPKEMLPPNLRRNDEGVIEPSSIADVLEWFLNYDERVARMRHPMVEELFQWKQADDQLNGVEIYPFENAEARFAIGVFQAIEQNNSEPILKLWITDVINALHEARESKQQVIDANKLDENAELSYLEKSNL